MSKKSFIWAAILALVLLVVAVFLVLRSREKLISEEAAEKPAQTVSYGQYDIQTKEGGGSSIIFKGARGKEHDEIVTNSIQVSADGKKIIYVALNKKPGASALTSPSVSVPAPAPVAPAITAPTLPLGGGVITEQFVVVNDQETNIYPIVSIFHLALSPNGSDFAFVASVRDADAIKYLAAFNGKQGVPYDDISGKNFIFGPDGSKIAYLAKDKDKYLIVMQDKSRLKESLRYDSEIESNFRFSLDGKSLIYKIKDTGLEEVLNF